MYRTINDSIKNVFDGRALDGVTIYFHLYSEALMVAMFLMWCTRWTVAWQTKIEKREEKMRNSTVKMCVSSSYFWGRRSRWVKPNMINTGT